MRRIEVEFGLKISDVTPAELGPLLDSLARLSRNGTVSMSPETQRVLAANALAALPSAPRPTAATNGHAPRLSAERVTAALTAWRGDVAKAAQALGKAPSTLTMFCYRHGIAPKAFRVAKEAPLVKTVTCSLLFAFLLLAAPLTVLATGPINPTTATVTLPQTNTDGSNLTDLALIRFCVGTSATAALTSCVTVASPAGDPAAGATLSTPLSAFALTTDGQYYVDAEAEDTAGNKSARATRVPFERNLLTPSGPTGLTVQ